MCKPSPWHQQRESKDLVHSRCCDERLPLCFLPAGLTFMRAGGRIDVGDECKLIRLW